MKKQILILSAVLVVLAAVIVFWANPLEDEFSHQDENPLFDFRQEDVRSFQINHFIQGLLFQKEGETWMVKRVKSELAQSIIEKDKTAPVAEEDKDFAEADPVKVAEALTILSTLKIGEPVASAPDSGALFQINDHSLHVIIYGEAKREVARLYIGKQGPDIMSSFIKRNRENDVYLVDQNLRGLFLYPYEEWLIKEEKTAETEQGRAKANGTEKVK